MRADEDAMAAHDHDLDDFEDRYLEDPHRDERPGREHVDDPDDDLEVIYSDVDRSPVTLRPIVGSALLVAVVVILVAVGFGM